MRVGDWKLVKGTTYQGSWDDWKGPSGRGGTYKLNKIFNSLVAQSIRDIKGIKLPSRTRVKELRQEATLKCNKPRHRTSPCHPLQQVCLFNITADPCEYNNLVVMYSHYPKSSFFVQKFNFDFPRKLSIFFGVKNS